MQLHSELFTARQYEMGTDHLVRIQSLCNYMEEAAGIHAHILGAGQDRLAEDNLAWVLAKLRLLVFKRPGPGETIRVDTWPVRMERAQFRRDFIVYDADGTVMATAVTQWVVMGFASRRLERFPFYIAAMEPEDPPLAQENGDIRIPALGKDAVSGPVFSVRLADIDQNNHVNNGRYVDFALESAEATGMTGVLSGIDIIFRAEGLRSDTIACKSQLEAGAPSSLLHSLYRQNDGQELVRARTVFA